MRTIPFFFLIIFLCACQSEPKLKLPAPEHDGGVLYTQGEQTADFEAYLLGDTLTQSLTAFIYTSNLASDTAQAWQVINPEGIRSDAVRVKWSTKGYGEIRFQPIHDFALHQQCDHRGFLKESYTLSNGNQEVVFQVSTPLPKSKEITAYRFQEPDASSKENVQQYYSERELTRDGLMFRVSAWASPDSLSFILKAVNRTTADVFFSPDSLLLAWEGQAGLRPQMVMGDFKAAKGLIGLPMSGRGEFEWKLAVKNPPHSLRLYSPIRKGLDGNALLQYTDWLPWASEPALSAEETQHN
ncbi:hypothetical protein QWY31_03440 [Cytophagales bacterium LB-30]|uniref:DUF3108 domain-containing protein n=1 Tax=Shiella aurantiaca TaxID=3058365 RepID=A0ABT8F2L1_9BACT|nr:hypothetical protein [Shiella aurantiaca]MDN4164538.1 hypothetical protein [Shiella aurantiaca]